MNGAPRYAKRLLTMIAFIISSSHVAAASDTASGATLRLAMGPMSAAQKNQGNPTADATPATPRLVARHHHSPHRPRHHHSHHVR
jgi:hypothetical protein